MTNNPKVSVVVPSLNSIKYIHECIDSILNQTLKDIEIICVDAGSTDGTLEVLREYERNDKRLKVIVSDKKSYGYQMNLGIKEAKGEYLGIVESDDYIKEDMYQVLYFTIEKFQCDVVRGNILGFEEVEGEKQFTELPISYIPELYFKLLNFKNDQRIIKDTWNMNQSGIYRLNFIKQNNIYFNETPGASYQDTGFWFQTSAFARSVYIHNEAYYCYRRDNPNSSCHSKEKVYCICEEYDFIRERFKDCIELNTIILPIIAYLRFLAYRWNLERIGNEFKQEFIYKIKNDFEIIRNNQELNEELFPEWHYAVYKSIMDNPNQYYCNMIGKPFGAVSKIKKQLSYKLGFRVVTSKSLLDIVSLPIAIMNIIFQHRFEKKVNSVIYENQPELKPKPIEDYADYYEALKIKQHLSYKVGSEMIQYPFTFIFRMNKVYKEYKDKCRK